MYKTFLTNYMYMNKSGLTQGSIILKEEDKATEQPQYAVILFTSCRDRGLERKKY